MRTKTLLLTAALVAAGVASSMAQGNVYSLNIVGYVNIPVTKGKLYLLQNPFDTGTGNNISNVVIQPYMGGTNDVPDPAKDAAWDSSLLYEFTQAGGYGDGETYFTGIGWFPAALTTAPGTGFFFISQATSNLTFTGSVVLNQTTTLPPGLSLVGSPYPGNTNVSNLGLVGSDSDVIYRWYPTAQTGGYTGLAQSFGAGVTYFAGVGWYDSDAPASSNGGLGGGSTNGPVLNVGEAFFYLNSKATALSWPQSFTVN